MNILITGVKGMVGTAPVMVMTCNEVFDPQRPDTLVEIV